MIAQVDRAGLAKILQLLVPATQTRLNLPELSGVRLQAASRELEVAAANPDLIIRVSLAAEVDEPGTVIVPGRQLQALIESAPNESLSLSSQGHSLTVRFSTATFELFGRSPDEFWTLPTHLDTYVNAPAGALLELISRTAFAAARDESRPALTGIFCEVDQSRLQVVAANGPLLLRASALLTTAHQHAERFVLPRQAAEALMRLFPPRGEVSFGVNGGYLCAQSPELNVWCRLLENDFPDFSRILLPQEGHAVLLPVEQTVAAIRRMLIVADRRTNRVTLSFSPGLLSIETSGSRFGRGGEQIALNWHGPPVRLNFDAVHLTELLEHCPTETCRVEMVSPVKAVRFESTGSELEKGYVGVLMPLRVQE
jgi:DNA polymerase-3 subunit beta